MKTLFPHEIVTISELATLANMDQNSLRNIVSGRRRPHALKAKALEAITGIDIHIWLFGTKAEIGFQLGVLGTESEKKNAVLALEKSIGNFKMKCK